MAPPPLRPRMVFVDDQGLAKSSLPHVARREDGFRSAWQQLFLTVLILLATDVFARGSGVLARGFFIVAAVSACIYYYRKSPWLYVTMTFWFWTTTALARRLIDFHAGFDPVDIVLGTPEFVSLIMLWDIINSCELMRKRETVPGLFIACPIFFAISVSLVQGELVQGVVGSADWIGPILYYFFVIAHWRRIQEFEGLIKPFLTLNVAVISLYCIFQFVIAPPWDAAWLVNSGLKGMGEPRPYEIRIFGSLNATGILASWLGMSMLLFLHFRTRLTTVLVPLAAMLVILSFVRSAAGAILVAYVVAGLLGHRGIFKILTIGSVGVTILFVALSSTLPEVKDLVVKRAASVEDLSHDTSANVRGDIWAATPKAIAAAPWGLGIGSIGRGAVVKQDNDDLSIVDSGVLGIYLPLGWVAGTVYFLGVILIIVQAWNAARVTHAPAAIAMTAAAVSMVLLLPFFNVLGIGAMQMWFCAAYAAAIGMHGRNRVQLSTRPVDRLVLPKRTLLLTRRV